MADYMALALAEAERASGYGEIPIGAVLIHKDEVIGTAFNQIETLRDPTAHAEMIVIRQATTHFNSPRLEACDIYVTLEPCTMCAAALSFARIRRLYFGAYDSKGGGVDHGARFYSQQTCHHRPEVFGGIYGDKCGDLLKMFFEKRR